MTAESGISPLQQPDREVTEGMNTSAHSPTPPIACLPVSIGPTHPEAEGVESQPIDVVCIGQSGSRRAWRRHPAQILVGD